MKTYPIGTKVFCDFIFQKPKGKIVEIVTPGTGKDLKGLVKVKLSETIGAYKKGEIIEVKTCYAVPIKQEFRKRGSCFRYVNTDYQFTN